ncbi:competence/damage-inducible protein A [Aurantiacibacter rhizosphaerae]|uniref:Competence/damage-inducible protein A n=1 Tax=Aurantiacibacter rhizosphaerae TaxID=2691582 RepID=A0A844XHR9_9SPHN|nr:molybdopterin-binding protein [Aurantiacibacter rhizosphaerae]MWV29279.1 competence/damage-inducible protein A [Aurantiacibacter rhizosphaerae]
MPDTTQPSAALIVIASEVLSGRTTDSHIARLAKWTRELGIALRHACVVPDDRQEIVAAIRGVRDTHDHIFTAGGLGATHDDITVHAVAEALDRPIVHNAEVEARMREHYGDRLREAHLKLAFLPSGAEIFMAEDRSMGVIRVGHVVMLAGIPDMADAMLELMRSHTSGGPITRQLVLGTDLAEEAFADDLANIQDRFADCALASYPLWRKGQSGTNIVLESLDPEQLDQCAADLRDCLVRLGGTAIEGGLDREARQQA